ncbi:MAG: putative phosphoribosyl transferase [Ilumatobacteraceae bacterium]
MDRHVFHDRRSAGALLGVEVAKAIVGSPVVLGLPRGGVPVAAGVAKAIDAPLDVIVVRKLGVPHQPELAMGAIGENGVVIVNRDVVRASQTSEQELAAVEARERAELDRRVGYVRSVRPHESLADRPAVIVDDGIATGATIRAAIQVARAYGASDVTVATPVAPVGVVEMLSAEADRVVCLAQPDPFGSVGRWYHDFEAVTDAEVLQYMSAALGRSTDSDAP